MTNKVKSYHDLRIWQSGIKLVKSIYGLTSNFPKNEVFGLSSQMQRAAVSIPSNIAEGQVRGSDKEFKRFLQIALASSAELETQIIIAKELRYLAEEDYNITIQALNELAKQIRSLSKHISNS